MIHQTFEMGWFHICTSRNAQVLTATRRSLQVDKSHSFLKRKDVDYWGAFTGWDQSSKHEKEWQKKKKKKKPTEKGKRAVRWWLVHLIPVFGKQKQVTLSDFGLYKPGLCSETISHTPKKSWILVKCSLPALLVIRFGLGFVCLDECFWLVGWLVGVFFFVLFFVGGGVSFLKTFL